MKGDENMAEKYIGLEDKKTYWVVPFKGQTKQEAIKEVNKKLKVSVKVLKCRLGFIREDRLYWTAHKEEVDPVWVVWKG